jgi:hypothetical protein
MNRKKTIEKLSKKLKHVSNDLKKVYSPASLRKYLKVEKELQIQLAYQEYEERRVD